MKFSPSLFYRTTGKHAVLSFLHTVGLVMLCWWWQAVGFTLGLEDLPAKKSMLLKRTLLMPDSTAVNRFAFVDVSGAKQLIDRTHPSGVEVITDRDKLTRFFKLFNRVAKSRYDYVLCDVLFDKSTPQDTALRQEMNKIRNLLIPYSTDDRGRVTLVFPEIQNGYSGLNNSSGLFSSEDLVKYKLIHENAMKTLPVRLYELVHQKPVDLQMGLTWINGRIGLNQPLLDCRVRNAQLGEGEDESRILQLDDVVVAMEANDSLAFDLFFADRAVIIGDFVNDRHNTVLGTMAGPVVVANVYLSLEAGDHLITLPVIACMFFLLWALSWIFLFPSPWTHKVHRWNEGLLPAYFLGAFAIYLVPVWIGSFLLFLFSGFYFNVVMPALYFSTFATARRYLQERRRRKQNNQPYAIPSASSVPLCPRCAREMHHLKSSGQD